MSVGGTLALHLRSCATLWTGLYLSLSFLCGLPALGLHIVGIGFLLCLITYFKLPAPDRDAAFDLLGADPRDVDGGSVASSEEADLKMEDTETSADLDPLGTVAHRAAGLDAPENTLAALQLAARNGARCVEFDVSFTKDGVPVVFHDDSALRCTGVDQLIDELTWEEVQKLDAAATHIFKYAS